MNWIFLVIIVVVEFHIIWNLAVWWTVKDHRRGITTQDPRLPMYSRKWNKFYWKICSWEEMKQREGERRW